LPGTERRPGFRHAQLRDLERIALDEVTWLPVRRALGVTAFGVNAWSADAGAVVIEPHDERSPAAGAHEELYVVLSGAATFTIDGARLDAAAGTLVQIDVGAQRTAVAEADATVVLVVGGPPDSVPTSPFEHYYAAQPAYDAGDYERAIEIASAGLAAHPRQPQIHYQLACFHARAGRPDQAREHLSIAYSGDSRTREWAAGDEDLAAVRDLP
jgi:quercetin dioxygenase-like cupin family protein